MSARIKRRRVMPGYHLSLGITITFLSLLILIPLTALFIKSFTLGWDEWKALLQSPQVLAAARLTFGLSTAAAALNVILGLLVTWVLVRYRFPGKRLLDAMVDLPFALPTAVAGITLTAIYGKNGWMGSLIAEAAASLRALWQPSGWIDDQLRTWSEFGAAYSPLGIFLALTFIGFPFVVRTLQPVMEDGGRDIEEAAATLGAGRLVVFTRVLLPRYLPALMTGFTLALARAIGEYGSVIFISGNLPMKTEILPLLIVSQLEQYNYAAAAAIAAAMLVASLVLLLIINLLQRKSASQQG